MLLYITYAIPAAMKLSGTSQPHLMMNRQEEYYLSARYRGVTRASGEIPANGTTTTMMMTMMMGIPPTGNRSLGPS